MAITSKMADSMRGIYPAREFYASCGLRPSAVDAVHAASMVALAAADPGSRRAALTDALAESLLAAAGFSAAVPSRR